MSVGQNSSPGDARWIGTSRPLTQHMGFGGCRQGKSHRFISGIYPLPHPQMCRTGLITPLSQRHSPAVARTSLYLSVFPRGTSPCGVRAPTHSCRVIPLFLRFAPLVSEMHADSHLVLVPFNWYRLTVPTVHCSSSLSCSLGSEIPGHEAGLARCRRPQLFSQGAGGGLLTALTVVRLLHFCSGAARASHVTSNRLLSAASVRRFGSWQRGLTLHGHTFSECLFTSLSCSLAGVSSIM